jgi:hypothetical protein
MNGGLSITQVAAKYKLSQTRTKAILAEYGTIRPYKMPVSKLTVDQITPLINEGIPIGEAAKRLNISRRNLTKFCIKNNLTFARKRIEPSGLTAIPTTTVLVCYALLQARAALDGTASAPIRSIAKALNCSHSFVSQINMMIEWCEGNVHHIPQEEPLCSSLQTATP